MPNWCENNVSIEGPTEAMQYFLDNYCVQDPNSESMYRISFEKIIPIEQMPDEEGKCKGFAQIEHQVERWGCKWDTHGDFNMEHEVFNSSADAEFQRSGFYGTFETPWSPPEKVVARIRKMFDDDPKMEGLDLQEWFYKEPGMELAGGI